MIEVTPLQGDTPQWIYRVRNLVLVDQSGSPTCVVLVLRRLDDAAIGRGQFMASVDAMPVPAAILRLHDRVFVEANDLFLRMTGLEQQPPHSTIGADALWPNARAWSRQGWRNAAR